MRVIVESGERCYTCYTGVKTMGALQSFEEHTLGQLIMYVSQ